MPLTLKIDGNNIISSCNGEEIKPSPIGQNYEVWTMIQRALKHKIHTISDEPVTEMNNIRTVTLEQL